MLKLYVQCLTFLNSSKSALDRKSREDGFVSAETIAIAVAGVLIVGGVYLVFREQLEGAIESLFERIGGWESS